MKRQQGPKGHKLTTHRAGNGTRLDSALGYCECGWQFSGWTKDMQSVRESHKCHLDAIRAAIAKAMGEQE